MAQDATVTAADIARLAAVGRAAVSNWRKRHDDFPRPVGGTAASPSFSLAEVQEWLRAQGKLSADTADEHLWQDLRRLADEAELADILAFAGAFLLYLHREPGGWPALAARTDAEVAAELPGAVLAVVGGLPGGAAFPGRLAARHVPVVRGLADLAAGRGPESTFEFLRERYLDLHKRRMYETPRGVAHLAVRLAPGAAAVLDPACGSGTFLLAALDEDPAVRLRGQEVDGALASLTALRLALRTGAAEIGAGDSLRADAFPDLEADLVVTAPPYNDRNWGYDELTADPRWEYGLPPRTEPELAWVQHALAHCRPGGLAVLLMPPAVADRRAGRRIRQQLLRRGALRAVIVLPLGAVPNMAVPLALWVLRRPDPAERPPSQVLMAEVAGDFAAEAAELWHRFTGDPEGDLDDPGRARAVRIIDLLDEQVDLTPARHLTPPPAAPAAEQVAARRAELLELLADLRGLLPEVDGGHGPPEVPQPPVAELARMGLLTVHQAPLKPAGAVVGAAAGSAFPLVLTAEDVVEGRPPSRVLADAAAPPDAVVVRRGDVVVPAVIRAPAARVVDEPGAVLGRHLFLLRPNPEQLDPHYLAGILRSSLNLRHYSTVSSSYRVDVRRAEIPLLPIEEQRRRGEAFRAVDAFAARLREAAAAGAGLARVLTDGLAEAGLEPRVTARGR
ncbi:N-6 DNA methylase [Actinomadura parmotrematis]|uniref:N-6 DNA methylase n=1 Tax=Actinomadura parmotrematis TaxID=2864039 RepID=A0ABS7FYL1_9ACTN|nr:N-6 DNA methylase [Actinomadura parmotrematis]MBW8485527.1 N-6 DNA methylase [Actinomadura parmotrematis]